MLRLLLILLALCVPSLAQAVVEYDDEMEGTTSGQFYYAPYFAADTSKAYTHVTDVKFSGSGSLRINYPSICQSSASSGTQCGGGIGRNYTPAEDVWKRGYYRMGGATDGTGTFAGYQPAGTKLWENESTHSPTASNYARMWLNMGGGGGSKTLAFAGERMPTSTQSPSLVFGGITLQDNRWYCIETHEKMNTVGQSNGIFELWVDGVRYLNKTDIPFRNSGTDSNAKWQEFGLVRQGGTGYIWLDRLAVSIDGNRVGCIGAPVPVDTTPPSPPTNLTAQ